MVYPALLPLMRTPRLPVVDWTDAPTDLNGLVRFAERRNLVSARVPSHFKRSLRVRWCRKWSRKTQVFFMEGSDGCFLLWKYDFCLLNWIRVEFTSSIQINKQIVRTMCVSDKPHLYPVRSFTYRTEQVRANEVLYKGWSYITAYIPEVLNPWLINMNEYFMLYKYMYMQLYAMGV